MKIAILHAGDMKSVSLGGIDRYIKSLIKFCDDGEITVFGTTVKGEHEIGKQYACNYCGKKYYFIPIIDDHKYPLTTRYMRKQVGLFSKLKKYDCIYSQRTEFVLPFIFSKQKKKLFEMIHGSSKYADIVWGKKKAKIILLFERLSICIAEKSYIILNRKEFGVPYYKEKYPKFANKIKYGKNPIDVSIYYRQDKEKIKKELGISFDKVILFSGRVEDNPKRVLFFPEIMKNVLKSEKDCCFIVMGDGKDRKRLQEMVKHNKIEKNFIFTGYIDDPHIISKYDNVADLSLNISMFEGTCTSNLESIACGTPVISTDVGDIREVIFNNENGIIIPNDNDTIINNAAEAIVKILREGIKMNDAFMKYSGDEVIKQLKNDMRRIK